MSSLVLVQQIRAGKIQHCIIGGHEQMEIAGPFQPGTAHKLSLEMYLHLRCVITSGQKN